MMPLGACASLHSLVQRAETLLGQADVACTALRATHRPEQACLALVQLQQALLDGREYIQREYEHISNSYGSHDAAEGDQTARVEFWMICGNIEDHLTNPLESLVQHFLHHGHHHNHHDHCHCHDHYHRHHHSHSTHWSLFRFDNGPRYHHNRHHHLAEYEARFQTMLNKWSTIKDSVSSCFDDLEARLKEKKEKEHNKGGKKEGGGKDQHDDKKRNTVANAVHDIMEATNIVDEEMRMISNVDERIHTMGRHSRRASFSSSSSSSSSRR
jgi:hypothetical protein